MNSTTLTTYSMTADVTYLKNRRLNDTVVWIVSGYDLPEDIMERDESTMSRLDLEIYGKGYENTKKIVITKIRSKKEIS